MGNCSSAPRLKVNLRAFIAASPTADGLGDEWYFDTMNVLLDRWAYSHVQFLRKRFLEATGDKGEKELDKKGFFKLFAELQDMPKAVAESAFRMFDTDNSGKLNFREFCCALALCCHLMSSDDEKIRFVFDMFDTNDDGLLGASDVQLLLEYALQKEDSAAESKQRVLDMKLELLGTTQHLTFERFYEWAQRNLDSLNNLLHTFQIVPSPEREREICEEILSRHQSLQEGSTWYCISHKWLQVWKAHAGWTGPSPGRRVGTSAVGLMTSSSNLGAFGSALPRDRTVSGESQLLADDDTGSEDVIAMIPEVGMGNGHHILTRPPEIDNSDLEGEHKGELKMNLVEHLDYELIPEEMWLKLVEWYGGGPAILRKVICMGQEQQPQVELYPPLVLVVVAGENGQPLPQFSRRFFISRQSSLAEVLQMLAEKLSRPVEKSRIWHRAKGEQWRRVQHMTQTLEEFLEGKVWDAGAFMLETQSASGAWPRDTLSTTDVTDTVTSATTDRELQRHFEVGDRVEAQSGVTNQWMRGTIVDVIQRDHSSAPSQVKVHYDSTVYKCDEWISTSSDRLAPLDTHTTAASTGVSVEGPPPTRGATGLQNLGNTCFLNATIQCMANTPLMKEYFLSSQYLRDISEKGNNGCRGKLAEEFGHVVTDIWSGKSSSLVPRNFKRTIDQIAPQFAGYEQHDAQELLAFFLDGLHEDLNRSAPASTGSKNGVGSSRRETGTPKLFSQKKPIRGGALGVPQSSPKRTKTAWKDKGGETTPGSSPPAHSEAAAELSPAVRDANGSETSEGSSLVLVGGSASAAAASSSMPGPPRASGGVSELLSEAYPLRSLEAMAAEACHIDDGTGLSKASNNVAMPEERAVQLPWSRSRLGGLAFVEDASRAATGGSVVGTGLTSGGASSSRRPGEDLLAVPSEEALSPTPKASAPGLSPQTHGPHEEPSGSPAHPPPDAPDASSDGRRPGTGGTDDTADGARPMGLLGKDFGSERSANAESISADSRGSGAILGGARGDGLRKGDAEKQQQGTSRWWSFAWRRGWGALDLPKDHGEHPHDSAGDRAPGSREAAGPSQPREPEHGGSVSSAGSISDPGSATPGATDPAASPVIREVMGHHSGLPGVREADPADPPRPPSAPVGGSTPLLGPEAGGGRSEVRSQTAELGGARLSGRAGGEVEEVASERLLEELRSKLPAGAAASAVAAAAAARCSEVSEDGMSGTTFNESEDFVPELLTPTRAGAYRRSLSLLNLSFRRAKPKSSQDDGPGSPKRRPRTPPTMMPLREEQQEDRSPMCSGGEGNESADYAEASETASIDPVAAAAAAAAAASASAAAGSSRSFLPWKGTVVSSTKPVRSREGSREPTEEEPSRRAGQPAERAASGEGRSRAKEKDSSAWPSFLRRSKSRDGSATRRPPPSRPLPVQHQGDIPVGDGISPAAGSAAPPESEVPVEAPPQEDPRGVPQEELPQPTGAATAAAGRPRDLSEPRRGAEPEGADDRPAHRPAGLGFPFLRAPWKSRTDVPRGPSPGKEPRGREARRPPGAVNGTEVAQEAEAEASSEEYCEVTASDAARDTTPRPDGLPPATAKEGGAPKEAAPAATAAAATTAAAGGSEDRPESAGEAAAANEGGEDGAADDEGEEEKVDEDRLPDEEKAALQWERYRARNRSLIVDVFEGQLRSQLTCCKCGTSSSTFEPFRYLSVPIPSNHIDRATLRVVFFPLPYSMSWGEERQQLVRYSVTVPKSSTVQRVERALSARLPVPMSSVLLAEVYRSRIHRYLDSNLALTDVRAEDQLFAFEILQNAQDLVHYQERYAPSRQRKERPEDPKKSLQTRVLLIQAMHRRVVDVCRSDGRTWAQRREVFGLPFVMSAASSWTYATLHDMLMLHARRFLKQPRREHARRGPPAPSAATAAADATPSEERQVPFVARIVNASGTACGACDRRNCTGCLLPKGSARLRLRAGLLTGAVGTAKIYLALDWVDSAVYDQEYVDNVADDASVAANSEWQERDGGSSEVAAGTVPISACIDAFAQPEEMKVENGNGVKCETCNEVVDVVKKLEVWREPDVLILHIKRFHFSGVHYEKLNTPVEVPLKELNLRPWIVGPSAANAAPYELYGVACHFGGMSGGHYTSFCLNHEGKEPIWLKFNDEHVTSVSLNQELDEISRQCYVLFYRKRAFSSSNLINYSSLL